MGKCDSCIIQKIMFLWLHYYLLLWSIQRIYNASLKMFKIFDSTAVDSSDDEDGMDYLSENFSSEVDWLFSGETTNCKKKNYHWTT